MLLKKQNHLSNILLWIIIFLVAGVLPLSAENLLRSGSAYDLIINGAGLDGYFTAIEASKKGLKVLVLDKRTSPGYDIAAKRKLWLKDEGLEDWDKNMLDLFFPVEEQKEIKNTTLLSPRESKVGNELLLFAGSIKKQMLRNLLNNNVDVLLMNDVCGIMTDATNSVTGVVVASKHGVFSIKGRNYIDATDCNFFSRNLFNSKYGIKEASFVLEFDNVKENNIHELTIPDVGVTADKVIIYPGKKDKDQYFVEFKFAVKTNDLSSIERRARFISMSISKNIVYADMTFNKARLIYTALECSFFVEGKIDTKIPLSNYFLVENNDNQYSCSSISEKLESARKSIEKIEKYRGVGITTAVYYAGGKIPYSESDEQLSENGFSTMLTPFPVTIFKVKSSRIPFLVVGAGTAGSLTALGASEKNTKVTVVEYYNDLGGTKTMAGVNDFYFGNKQHELIKNIEKERKTFGGEHNMSLGRSTIPRRFYYLDMLNRKNINIINGAIVCGVETYNNTLKSIYYSENGMIKKIDARLTVDATGDADVAQFAGAECLTGDSRMGITQNYSHWDVAFRPEKKDYNRDYDIINSNEILEYQRGLYLAHSEAHYYDFYPMQAIRESRRPKAAYTITLSDILKGKCHDDVISQARSDYDPHYFGNSEFTRCGLVLPHYDNKAMVNIPYRAIVPEKIDGLLFSGKAIGLTHDALQFTRMSADITVLGYVTGLIASDILKQGVLARDFSVNKIQKELIDRNYLSDGLSVKNQESAKEIVAKLENGDNTYLLKTIIENKNEIVPLLKKSFNEKSSILTAKALAWFGEKEGQEFILKELSDLYRQELLEGHSDLYFEVYNPEIIYWKVNQNIALLAMNGNDKSNAEINTILSETVSGGSMVESADAYKHGRIDLQLIPYYNRIVNLCFYIERNPDKRFIGGLEQLINDNNIRNYKTSEYDKTRWRVYSANLELLLASSLARCGSENGLQILVDYLDDIHSDFRRFALNELVSITKADFGYDASEWYKYLLNNKNFDICPLKKEVEL